MTHTDDYETYLIVQIREPRGETPGWKPPRATQVRRAIHDVAKVHELDVSDVILNDGCHPRHRLVVGAALESTRRAFSDVMQLFRGEQAR